MENIPRVLKVYVLPNGNAPFTAWFRSIPDKRAQNIIENRLKRIKLGLFGDVKPIGFGLSEIRIQYGQGFRIYFGQDGRFVIVLLAGGDKSSQGHDILRAIEYWQNYKGRGK